MGFKGNIATVVVLLYKYENIVIMTMAKQRRSGRIANFLIYRLSFFSCDFHSYRALLSEEA